MSRGVFFIFLMFACTNLWAGDNSSLALQSGEEPAANPSLVFMENKGQVKGADGNGRADILYIFRSRDLTVFVHKKGLYYQFRKEEAESDSERAKRLHPETGDGAPHEGGEEGEKRGITVYQLGMQLLDTQGSARAVGMKTTPYYENYYNGASGTRGFSRAESYEQILIRDVYPHIDWVLSIAAGQLKYDFIVRPGGKPGDIKMRYEGAEEILLHQDGSLHITTPLGEISETPPFTYQQPAAEKTVVESRYRLLDETTIGFAVGDYRQDRPLVIDPAVLWSSYYGGSGLEYGTTTASDAAGNIYMAGWTESSAAIAISGHQNTIAGQYDAFLVKFDAAGDRQWATYYGGDRDDKASQIRLDSRGYIYLAGETNSDDGIAAGGHQDTYGGGGDGFLVKFNPEGRREWATYYGGAGFDGGHGIAIDGQDNIYLTGITASTSSIAAGGFQQQFGGQYDAFLVKFNARGERQWGTYYGGSGQDNTEDGHKGSVAVDGDGNIYITGWTSSPAGIAGGGHQNTFGGSGDAFLAKFNPQGNRLWGTYYGGDGFDSGRGIATDGSNHVYLAGITRSTSGIASGGFQNSPGGHYDAFLVKFNEAGDRLWATYYGGSGQDESKESALCVDAEDNVYLAGFTNSTDKIASCGFQNQFGGHFDAFVVKFGPEGGRHWGSYFGGEGFEITFDTRLDHQDHLYLVGWTTSREGIAYGGFQNTYGGGGDGFLVKVDPASDWLEEPEIAVEGTIPLCPGERVELSVPPVEGVVYEWRRDEQLISTDGNTLTVQEAGNYTVTLLTACDTVTSEPLKVALFETAEAPAISASASLPLCDGESVSLSVPESEGFSYQWLKDGAPTGDASSQLMVTESGLYSLVCTNECGSLTTEAVLVEAGTIPDPPDAYGDTHCGPGRLSLRAEGSSAAEYRWYESAEATIPIAGASGSEFITPVLENSKTYYVSVVEGSCESARTAVKAVISEVPVAYAGEDVTIPPGEQLQLQGGGGGTYSWSPAEGLSDASIPNPLVQPEKTTTYTLTVSNEEGCSAVDEVTITVVNEVFIPNAFSPNNDGMNDEWEIFNIKMFPACKVVVYDRWGNTLYESKGYKVAWDGKYQGEVLPTGSYAYVIQLSGEHKPVRGMLMIIH